MNFLNCTNGILTQRLKHQNQTFKIFETQRLRDSKIRIRQTENIRDSETQRLTMCYLPNICQWICRQGMDADRKRGKIKTLLSRLRDSELKIRCIYYFNTLYYKATQIALPTNDSVGPLTRSLGPRLTRAPRTAPA